MNQAAKPGGNPDVTVQGKQGYYDILDEAEAKSVIAGKENKEKDVYGGMNRVYDYLLDATNKDLLHTTDKIEQDFRNQNYRVRDILDYFVNGVRTQSSNTPIVHLHVYLKLVGGKSLQPVVVFAASHAKDKIKSVCAKYNRISVEEIIKRAQSQKSKAFKSAAEHEKLLGTRIAKNEFHKTYALWFLEDELKKYKEYQDATARILHTEIYPMLSSYRQDANGLFYRDINREFKSFGLKPIVLFNDKKEILRRYRFIVKDSFLEGIAKKLGDGDIKSQAEEAKRQIEEDFENPEMIANLAKQTFDKVIKGLGGNAPSESQLQMLQILLEIFAVKSNVAKMIEEEQQKRMTEVVAKIRGHNDVFYFLPKDEPSDFMLENLQKNADLYYAKYPMSGDLLHFFLAKENADKIVRDIEKVIIDRKYNTPPFNSIDDVQLRVDVLSRMLPNAPSFKSLRKSFVGAKVGVLTKIWNFIVNLFRGKKGKQPLEEKIWNKIKSSTDRNIEKIETDRKQKEERQLEKERKKRMRELADQKRSEESEPEAADDDDEVPQGEEEAAAPVDEQVAEKIKDVARHIPKAWASFFANVSLLNYMPPVRKDVAEILGIKPDVVNPYIKKHSSVFRDNGIAYIQLKKSGTQIFVTRNILKRWGNLMTDVFDAIDKYEFHNRLRDDNGTRRMDFAHEVASFLHGKGFKEKQPPKLLSSYQAILDYPENKPEEHLAAARFIVGLMQKIAG